MRRKLTTFVRKFASSGMASGLAIASAFLLGAPSSQAQTTTPTPYCGASHTFNTFPCNTNLAALGRVVLNTMDFNTPCNTSRGTYTFWNNVAATTIDPGSNYSMQVHSGITNTYLQETGVWIDYNGDGDFADPGEFVFRGEGNGAGGALVRSFQVPCTAVAGTTRMRVRIDYDYNNSPYNWAQANACGVGSYASGGYGETWDFNVNIGSVSPANANYTVPDTVYVNSPAKFINSNRSGYIKHYWDVINAGNAPDDSTLDFTYTFPSAGTYQLRLTSINCQGTDIETKTITVVTPTSSPIANFVTSENELVFDGSTLLEIDFFDLSQFGPTSWEWIMDPDWLNGAPFFWNGSAYDQNPKGLFFDFEDYDVCLVVSNAAGTDTLCKSNYIRIVAPGTGTSANVENWMKRDQSSALDSGWIYDSGGPNGTYQINEYETFVIRPCGASTITLNFTAFDLQNNGDFLSVFDGPSTASPQIGNFTGTTIPNAVTAKSGFMTLVFSSNNFTNRPGFAAYWTADIPPVGAPVADFMVPDSVFECMAGSDVYFENTSQNAPKGTTYDWIFEYSSQISYPSGYADINGEENPTWQYTANNTYDVRMILLSCAGNDTVVKSFVRAPSVGNPIVDFKTTERILKVNGTSTFTADLRNACGWEWSIFPATYSIENGGSVNDREITVKFTAPGSYNITLTADNDNGQTVEEKTNHVDVISYCNPAVNIPTVADVGITRVKINDINNESDAAKDGGFKDYSNDISTSLVLGQTYSVEVHRKTTVNNVNRRVWIDYNRDGDFDDVNELVASEVNSPNAIFTSNFTVPGIQDGVIAGEAKMRVAIGLANTNLPPCGPTSVGEYEDYTVFLTLDDMAPMITVIGSDTSIEVNTMYVDPGFTAMDNIEGMIVDPSRLFTDNGVDTSQAGIYFVTYRATDKSGNTSIIAVRRVVVVADMTEPVVTVNGADPLLWSVMVPYVDPMASSVDMPGNNTSLAVSMSGMVDVETIGDYVITYEVTDFYGNTGTATRTVQVRDTTAPMINANAVYQIQVGQPFAVPFQITDNFDQNVQLMVTNNTVVNPNVIGTYVVEYAAMDASGNMAQNVTVTYEVADYVPPVLSFVPGTDEVFVDVFDAAWESKPGMKVTASDAYYGAANVTKVLPADFTIDSLGSYVITYRAEDNGGNVSTWTRTIHVVDRVKPEVLTNPLNLPRWSYYDFQDGVNVKDNYFTPADFLDQSRGCQLLVVRNNVDFNYPGLYQVVYVARDGAGNSSSETTRLVVISEDKLSVNSADLVNAMNVYPNPNNGQFTLEVSATLGANTTVNVVNAVGTVVKTIDASELIDNGQVSIDMNNATPGVYFIQIVDNGQVATKKVVITN